PSALQSSARPAGALLRLARVGTGQLAFLEDDHASACGPADGHGTAQAALFEKAEQGRHVNPGRVKLRIDGVSNRELEEPVDQLRGQSDDVEDSKAPVDFLVEVDQGDLAQFRSRVVAGVVDALQDGPLPKVDQAVRVFGEEPDVSGVPLSLQGGDQPGEVDEGRLER